MADNANSLIERYHLKSNPRSGLISATIGFFVGFAAVSLYGPTGPHFKEAMALSGTMLGLLVAIPQLTGSLLRIPFGAWVDKVGGKRPLTTLLVLSIVGLGGVTLMLLLLFPEQLTADYYPLILVFGALSGCGVATFSVGIPQTSYWYPQKRQGVALGTYAGLGNMAPGIFTLLIPLVLAAWGVPGAYAAWLAFLVIGTIVYVLIAHDAYYFQLRANGEDEATSKQVAGELGQELFPSGKVMEALKTSAKVGRTWALVFLYFTSFGGFLALTSWFPSYWQILHGFGPGLAGVLGGVGFSLLASVVRVYGGHVSDRFGGERIAILSFSMVLVGALLLVFGLSFVPSLIGELVIAVGMGMGNAAVFKLVAKYVPEAVGGASGWVGGLGAFGGFVVPPLLGLFVDLFGEAGWSRGFIVYIVLAVICIAIALILRKRFGAQS
jgi:NNP family nitrate/nitrite transporter-like MFS transporter